MKSRLDLNALASDERVRLGFLVLLASTIFFSKLGLNGMANFDDCFYAEKAKEMAQSGDWRVQTFNHVKDFGNAPFFIWLVALSYKVFGVGVYAAKFPSALMGLGTVLLVYFLGRYLFDSWMGFAAGVVLTTTYTFFKYARHCMLDVTLAFFCTLALFALVLAVRKDGRFFWLWGLALGLAFLTKSALGLFPLIVTLVFLALARQWKVLAWPSFWGGLALQGAIAAGWCLNQYQAGGEQFLREHWKGVILEKAYLGDSPHWTQRFSFLRDMLTFNWFWIPFMAWGLWLLFKKAREEDPIPLRPGTKDPSSSSSGYGGQAALLLLIWSLTLPIVMSGMRYRMVWYLMQVFPAFALTAAFALGEFLSGEKRIRWTKWFMTVGMAAIVLVNALPFPLDKDRERDTRLIAPYVKHFAGNGAKVIALREEYYGLNNALLFFSDYAAQPLYQDVESVVKELGAKEPVLCVAHKGDLPGIQKAAREWYPVKYGEDLILISNQRLDVSDVHAEEELCRN